MTVLRLRLRAWLGWGRSSDDLRAQSAQLFKAALVGLLGYGLLAPLFFFIVGMFYKSFGTFIHTLLMTRAGLIYGGLLIALTLYIVIPALSHRRLAQRGENQPPSTIYGRCYKVLRGKSDIFTRIGNTAETAQWYRLPLAWEAVVGPGDAEYELTANPVMGFVERLRRLGDSPKEVRQFSAMEVEMGQADGSYYRIYNQSDESSGAATEEQRREVELLAKSYRLDLATDPRSLLLWALVGLSLGLIFALFAVGLLLIWLWGLLAPEAGGVLLLLLAILLIFMVVCLIPSIGALRDWNYAKRFENETPEHFEGDVIYWASYDGDTLARMRADDGSTEVFRIHRRWEKRVRAPNQRFRVTYLPTTHRVLDVRLVGNQYVAWQAIFCST
jgi:hypothetical protein